MLQQEGYTLHNRWYCSSLNHSRRHTFLRTLSGRGNTSRVSPTWLHSDVFVRLLRPTQSCDALWRTRAEGGPCGDDPGTLVLEQPGATVLEPPAFRPQASLQSFPDACRALVQSGSPEDWHLRAGTMSPFLQCGPSSSPQHSL